MQWGPRGNPWHMGLNMDLSMEGNLEAKASGEVNSRQIREWMWWRFLFRNHCGLAFESCVIMGHLVQNPEVNSSTGVSETGDVIGLGPQEELEKTREGGAKPLFNKLAHTRRCCQPSPTSHVLFLQWPQVLVTLQDPMHLISASPGQWFLPPMKNIS